MNEPTFLLRMANNTAERTKRASDAVIALSPKAQNRTPAYMGCLTYSAAGMQGIISQLAGWFRHLGASEG